MATLVQNVLHKETQERILIKKDRYDPNLHEYLPGDASEPFMSHKGVVASEINVPKGVKQPKLSELDKADRPALDKKEAEADAEEEKEAKAEFQKEKEAREKDEGDPS